MPPKKLILKKVKVHNLKEVDLTLNAGELIVFTGVSGSGKSSLAFDTIYVEGQRRYIESLSHQVRSLLGSLPKPDAKSITGMAPTIAIEQKTAGKTPRSTVGTMTGIYDFLRVLFARLGTPHCPLSKEPLGAQSFEAILATIRQKPDGELWVFLAPYAKGKKGEFTQDFQDISSKGFTRIRLDGKIIEMEEAISLDKTVSHDIDLVVDRIVLNEESKKRLAESIQTSLELGKGIFSLYNPKTEEELLFSQHAFAKKSGLSYPPLSPHDFSFNHPSGMCPNCQGLGIASEFDLSKIIDPNKSIAEDCCAIASSYQTIRHGNIYNHLAKIHQFKISTPWKNIPEKGQKEFLYGFKDKWTKIFFSHPEKKKRWHEYVQWKGVLAEAKERLHAAKSDRYRKNMGAWMIEQTCPECQGSRIHPYPAATKFHGKTLQEITALSLEEALCFFQTLVLSPLEEEIGGEIVKEIIQRLIFLTDVGLAYLCLGRTSPTLSGGESQRVRLASQIGAGLVGAIYVLDEPSIGLHPIDHHRLIATLLRLRDQGNTVIVVEHDIDTMKAADCIVDVGPASGSKGGEILVVGSLQEVMQHPRSITGGYLSGRLSLEIRKKKRKPTKEKIIIRGASHHNLKQVDVSIPLGIFSVVTGVSGSGKSSLILDTLYPALANSLHGAQLPVGKHKEIKGLEAIDKVIAIDQSPIGRTPRSNPATYIKLFDEIRDLYTSLPESKLRGFGPGHFSFNVKEGSCPYCGGLGSVKIDMDFMEDAWVTCPQCEGKRFSPEVLSVLFKNKHISDILDMPIEEALVFFDAFPSIQRKLRLLVEVGLGSLCIGQPSTTLSGGEAQRIKLAKELIRPSTGKTLYILDEPTTGLHIHDVKKLLSILQGLVDKKNSVLVIEHNLETIQAADWIIDLGPGAGIYGGEVIGQGPPETIQKTDHPTGKALKGELSSFSSKKEKFQTISPDAIVIKGASQNNLKSISTKIPRNQITVFSGPSGSGKSSLAFETIYAEGQRRYIETLSPYARSLVKQLSKPKVEQIEGLSPSIALEQKTGGLNPRSTVGTMSEIYDLLRIFYAHQGTAFDPDTQEKIQEISKETVVNRVMSLEKEKIYILSPITLSKKESLIERLQKIGKEGFLRIRLNQEYFEIDQEIPFDPSKKNELYLVVDRLQVDSSQKMRLFESVDKAATLSKGIIVIATPTKDLYFNLSFAVESTGACFPPITPQTFSFNHDEGMCLECQGLGMTYGAHLESMREIQRLSPFAILDRLWKEKSSSKSFQILETLFRKMGVDIDLPFNKLGAKEKEIFLKGGEEIEIKSPLHLKWMGIESLLARLARMAKGGIKEKLLPYMQAAPCQSCEGSRLNPLARNVRIEEISLPTLCHFPLDKVLAFMTPLQVSPFLEETHQEIIKKLSFLLSLGLDYLSLDRSAPTLSGGELQRIRLARQLGSGLTSCLYVLDEPTIGLHPANNEQLGKALRNLADQGNTLVLVEHDPMTLKSADYLIDFGPQAGRLGGEIVAEGTLEEIQNNPHSLTGAYLSGKKTAAIPKKKRPLQFSLKIQGAHLNNLKAIDVSFPLEAMSCLIGPSGSGKSTLMRHLLKPAAEIALQKRIVPDPFLYQKTTFEGLSHFENVISIDQSPMGQTARSDVSTYSEIQPLLRSHFASLSLAKMRGLTGGHFSPNHLRGMCRTCWGLGYKKVDLQFLPAVQVVCDGCQGHRLNPLSLQVLYKGKHFGNILQMSVEEALGWFQEVPRIAKRLQVLIDVGLGYVELGQPLATLSGGEAQRLRLSLELSKRSSGKTLYLIDEPTVGLHFEDVKRLLKIFDGLVQKKNTLIVIEHNIDLIQSADHLIELGPDAGERGGEVIATGRVEEIRSNPRSKTGRFLSQ